MAIIHMAESKAEAEQKGLNVRMIHTQSCALNEVTGKYDAEFERFIWLYETHHGLCIHDSEVNGYDDSDFYMTVWNAEKQEPERICFASTRGWSYPCYGSSPDAAPEVMAQYDAYCKRQ